MALYCFMAMKCSLHRPCHWKMYLIRPVPVIHLPEVLWVIWQKPEISAFENMKTAIIVGSAMASFCVEKFGPTRLKEITKEDIDRRIQQFKDLVSFEIELV